MLKNRLAVISIFVSTILLSGCLGGSSGSSSSGSGGASTSYMIGGTVSGLASSTSLVLQHNAGDNLTVSANGTFTFATSVASGGAYSVTVKTQPAAQSCVVVNGSGSVASANVTTPTITCTSTLLGGTVQSALHLTGTVSSFTGTPNTWMATGSQNGAAATATFNGPQGMTTDGTNLYVVDYWNNMIRKIVIATGATSTLAGTGSSGAVDGIGTAASFSSPNDITTDGVNLYVTDTGNYKIRKIVIATGQVTSLTGSPNTTMSFGYTDGPASSAAFAGPQAITTDGTNLYVVDSCKIRQIVISTGVVSSLTGVASSYTPSGATDGAAVSATFNVPTGIATDGANLYVADTWNHKIRKVVIATGFVSSLTGVANTAANSGATDGANASAMFNVPKGITTDGTNLYVAEAGNSKIRQLVLSTGAVSSITGLANTQMNPNPFDGTTSAVFNTPRGIVSDGTSLYVSDSSNNKIRKIQ